MVVYLPFMPQEEALEKGPGETTVAVTRTRPETIVSPPILNLPSRNSDISLSPSEDLVLEEVLVLLPPSLLLPSVPW